MDDAPACVGLVIVSHSARIAEGTTELAGQMAGPDVRIVPAGGLDDGSIGTDAMRIAAAIGEADAGAGVVIVADLGSAVLSAVSAIEILDNPANVRLSKGPIVEGAVMAAVQASVGSSLDEVLEAAEGHEICRKADKRLDWRGGSTRAALAPGLVAGGRR